MVDIPLFNADFAGKIRPFRAPETYARPQLACEKKRIMLLLFLLGEDLEAIAQHMAQAVPIVSFEIIGVKARGRSYSSCA